MLQLPEGFETFTEARKNGFLKILDMKRQNGKKVVGVFCSYTPVELITAANATYVSLCGTGEEGIVASERHLPKNLCPLIKSSYGLALTDSCPYFYFSDVILAETTCDGKKKMYELMGRMKPTHIMSLPNSPIGEAAEELWLSEIYRAKEFLEKELETTITEEKVREAIHQKNLERQAMVRLYEIGKLNPCPLSGYELSTIIESTAFMFSGQKKVDVMNKRAEELVAEYEKNFRGKSSGPRILITGCPFDGVRDKIIKELEIQGASVVAFENCSGPRTQENLVDETIDPYRALARRYLGVSCSVMTPNAKRFETLREMVDEYQIDAVLEIVLHCCHTYAIESQMIQEFVNDELELPFLSITTDYSVADTGQLATRIGAFLEILHK